MSATITEDQLREVHACRPQLRLFVATFGESTTVTAAKCRKVAGLFDWDWACCLLDDEGRAEYERDTATAYTKYRRTTKTISHVRTKLAEYERVTAIADIEYERDTATAWARAYIATCKRRVE